MDAGGAGARVLLYQTHDVQLVAIAGVAVGDHGRVGGAHHAGGVVDHLGHRHQPVVGKAQRCGGAGAGHVDHREARLHDQPSGDRVIGAGRCEHAVLPQQGAQTGSVAGWHEGSPTRFAAV